MILALRIIALLFFVAAGLGQLTWMRKNPHRERYARIWLLWTVHGALFCLFLLLWHYLGFFGGMDPGKVNIWSIILKIQGAGTAAFTSIMATLYENGSPDGFVK